MNLPMAKQRTKHSGVIEPPHISIVVPLLNEEESLRELFMRVNETMQSMKKSFEIIFVDDGSTDRSFEVLTALHTENPDIVKAIRFRRNFGKSAALSAGFKEAQGEYIITMDADLQDDPNEIPSLIEALGDSYDLVSGWKKKRRDSIIFTFPSHIANAITSKMTGLHDS